MSRALKWFFCIVVLCLVVFQLVGCACKHEWREATCTEPKTCTICGETEEEPLGHDWTKVTCISPRTCMRCGETQGEALGHDWQKATCTEPRRCERCGETDGKALGHDWNEATCTDPKICVRCGKIDGAELGHDWKEATCINPKTCNRCGETEGEPNGHVVNTWTVKEPASCVEQGTEKGICEVCGEEQTRILKKLNHDYGDWITLKKATCSEKGTKKRVCKNCGFEETHEIALEAHQAGEWEIVKEATYSDSGIHVQKCKKCGKEIRKEIYTISYNERISWLKKNCKSNAYNDLMRSPNQCKGEYVQFSCKILQIVYETTSADKHSEYRAATKGNWDNDVYLYIKNYPELNGTSLSPQIENETPQRQGALKIAFELGYLDNIDSSYDYVSYSAAEKAVASNPTTYSIRYSDGVQKLLKTIKRADGSYDVYSKYIYNMTVDNIRILENDRIMVYGIFDGLMTYTSVLGQSITIPKIIVLYYVINTK